MTRVGEEKNNSTLKVFGKEKNKMDIRGLG